MGWKGIPALRNVLFSWHYAQEPFYLRYYSICLYLTQASQVNVNAERLLVEDYRTLDINPPSSSYPLRTHAARRRT